MAAFLTYLKEVEKLSFSSINTARSAISSLVSREKEIGKHWLICRVLRGVYNKKPVLPNNVIWDTSKVLKFLEKWHPAKNLSLRQLSIKTVLLCLLVSGQRGQTIWAMEKDKLTFEENCARCTITVVLKTSGPRHHTSELVFKRYTPNSALCARHYLSQYRRRTEKLRGGGAKGFFIRTTFPYTPIKRGTLSSWSREGLRLAGVNVDNFSPHSTRAASTSKVKKSGYVKLTTILKSAGWRNAKTFARFYDKTIEDEGWNASSLI